MKPTLSAGFLAVLIATGAVAGMARPSYNVKSYGARGDGSDHRGLQRRSRAGAEQ